MKQFIFCMAIAATVTLNAKAQDNERIFKRFKGDVSLGYAAPLATGANGGFLFAMEPKFALMDQLSVGLRMEGAITGKFKQDDVYGDAELENAKGLGSYIATADYYFTNNYSFRPFVGAGIGVVRVLTGIDDLDYSSNATTITKGGGIIRAGGEVKHFRFGIEYNFIPRTDVNYYNDQGVLTKEKSKNAYVGIKLGFCFGGGPR